MRVFYIDRARMTGEPLVFPTGEFHDPAVTLRIFDDRRLPNGLPFALDDDGRTDGCASINQYLLDAWDQRGLTVPSMRNLAYAFVKMLTHVRRSHAAQMAEAANTDPVEWLREHGEPKIDLTEVTRDDRIHYRDSRVTQVEPATLANELHRLGAFYRYALRKGWIAIDPTPRWGQAQRNTLIPRTRRVRVEKFLNAEQTRHFLDAGLRGDGQKTDIPAFPERDYAFGLALVTSGLRRSEGATLLDLEIPQLQDMPPSGVASLVRKGKKDVLRRVYLTRELVSAPRIYREAERARIVDAAQPRLRRLRREGALFLIDGIDTHRGQPSVIVGRRTIPTDRLDDDKRAVAAQVLPNGDIEPLGLFLSRSALPPSISYWNELFQRARDRVDLSGSDQRPPAHITVTPHTLRHTFAVRMLAALMRDGQERANDPYFLLVNPLLTVQQLLGHASVETTQAYLFAAETWQEELPRSLRAVASSLSSDLEAST